MEQHFIDTLMDGLDILHKKRMFCKDLHLKNIVVALDKDEDSTYGLNFEFRFIDFERSVCPYDNVCLNKENILIFTLLSFNVNIIYI